MGLMPCGHIKKIMAQKQEHLSFGFLGFKLTVANPGWFSVAIIVLVLVFLLAYLKL
jgi:hypothetical protein